MIREATELDCINLTALSLEVWFQTYSIDGIRTENSKFALSSFNERYFKEILHDNKYKLLVFTEGIYLRGYILVNFKSQFESKKHGFEIERLYVHGPFQGNGIGPKLLLEIKDRYGSQFWLYTWVCNKSIAFYKKFGFKDIGRYDFKLGNDVIENRVMVYEPTKR